MAVGPDSLIGTSTYVVRNSAAVRLIPGRSSQVPPPSVPYTGMNALLQRLARVDLTAPLDVPRAVATSRHGR